MKKDIQYYMNLGYTIEIATIPEDEGGGYAASIPQLGKFAFVGDGETRAEALENLDAAKRDLFESYLQRGIPIPEPEQEEKYSGRFVVRVPITLHAELSKQAENNGCSLNQYVTTLLSVAATARGIGTAIENEVLKIRQTWGGRSLEGFHYSFSEPAMTTDPQLPPVSFTQHYRKTG